MVCSLDLPVRVADRPKKLPPYIVGLTATRTWTSRLHNTKPHDGSAVIQSVAIKPADLVVGWQSAEPSGTRTVLSFNADYLIQTVCEPDNR